jgi:hypothetical protein
MKFLDNITKSETRFQRYIGLKFGQLNVLVQSITPLWQDSEHKRLTCKNRIRNIGGGNEYTLESMKEKIIVVLMYYKMHLTQEFLGDLAGLDQSNVSRLLKKMLPLIEAAADPELKNYLEQAKEGCNKIATFAELCEQYPDLRDTATDATEQPCYRSKKYDVQKEYYSGKSKQHAIKVQLTVAAGGRILDVTATYAGSVHDKKIMDQEKTVEKFDERVPQRFDSGYQGTKDEYPDYYVIGTIKKPKGGELTPLQKELNRAHGKRRIIAEHGISRTKKFKICANTFRQPLSTHNQTFRNVVAILNFRRAYSAATA